MTVPGQCRPLYVTGPTLKVCVTMCDAALDGELVVHPGSTPQSSLRPTKLVFLYILWDAADEYVESAYVTALFVCRASVSHTQILLNCGQMQPERRTRTPSDAAQSQT